MDRLGLANISFFILSSGGRFDISVCTLCGEPIHRQQYSFRIHNNLGLFTIYINRNIVNHTKSFKYIIILFCIFNTANLTCIYNGI